MNSLGWPPQLTTLQILRSGQHCLSAVLRETHTLGHIGIVTAGDGDGVEEGLGVALGVELGVTLGVALGVELEVGVGVTRGTHLN